MLNKKELQYLHDLVNNKNISVTLDMVETAANVQTKILLLLQAELAKETQSSQNS